MMARLLAVAALFWAAVALPAGAQTQPARTPTVVELYTSQGCWTCARANRFAGTLSREDNLLVLTFNVSYWDYMGWRDSFAQPEFEDRQRAFATTLRGRRATPQFVLDGVRHVSATDWDVARSALQQVQATPRPTGAPSVSIQRISNRARAIVGGGSGEADVWLLAFEPGPVRAYITAGENDGRVVLHYNLVRRIWRAGGWRGSPTYFEQTRCIPECAVIVQTPNGGPILGAAFTQRRSRR